MTIVIQGNNLVIPPEDIRALQGARRACQELGGCLHMVNTDLAATALAAAVQLGVLLSAIEVPEEADDAQKVGGPTASSVRQG